ncbi:50S ribosomal protein L11 methyltransferase [Polynucleobacter tropicus]|uniref:Ribosomal protein L11 methyltransferase n=2 Tax=Polynucleobacter tropicus TaxID=1743174 RepID=A0A6M9Q5J6_9BURK|nr:50S ribosomal protein L11 methyltransferase [Polynucleobacter tropicus]
MSYRELVFTVAAETAEPLGDALLELGALSVTVEDDAAGGYDENPLYGEPGLSPEVQAWDRSSVTALFNPEIDASGSAEFIPELLASLKEAGFKLSSPQEKTVEEQDWVRLTQSQFAPIQIGKRIWVVPSWHEAPNDSNAICLAVDPGLAFGTGSHPTTHLCLLWLEEHQNLLNQSLLDYGCGSGILAIAAAKLGCNPVVGTDIDPQAMVAARSNAEINNTEIRFVLPTEGAPELAAERKYDIVMANILANPLQVLAPALVNKMRPGGQIVLSGVLARQADEVITTYSQWLKLSVWRESEGWVCLHGTMGVEQKNGSNSTADADSAQKKRFKRSKYLKPTLLSLLFLVSLIFGEHLFRNTLIPALAPRIDGTSNAVAVRTFSLLQFVDQKLCSALGCFNRPVSDFSAWKITSATLSSESARDGLKSPANQSILQIEIQNRLAIPILFPNLEISLTDAEESELKTIHLTPKEWLSPSWQESHPDFLKNGAPAGEIILAELPILLPANAAGYRVHVIYPH